MLELGTSALGVLVTRDLAEVLWVVVVTKEVGMVGAATMSVAKGILKLACVADRSLEKDSGGGSVVGRGHGRS